MAIKLSFVILNQSETPLGPLDLTGIFGKVNKPDNDVFVPPKEKLRLEVDLSGPLDDVNSRFAQRCAELGFTATDVQLHSFFQQQPVEGSGVQTKYENKPPDHVYPQPLVDREGINPDAPDLPSSLIPPGSDMVLPQDTSGST